MWRTSTGAALSWGWSPFGPCCCLCCLCCCSSALGWSRGVLRKIGWAYVGNTEWPRCRWHLFLMPCEQFHFSSAIRITQHRMHIRTSSRASTAMIISHSLLGQLEGCDDSAQSASAAYEQTQAKMLRVYMLYTQDYTEPLIYVYTLATVCI